MDREPKNARYCAECKRLHPAEEGDFWAESSMFGLKITYFALMDGKVYDITGILLFSKSMGSYNFKTVAFLANYLSCLQSGLDASVWGYPQILTESPITSHLVRGCQAPVGVRGRWYFFQ